MKKSDLVKIAEANLPDPLRIVNAIFREINKSLLAREDVKIANFGRFSVTEVRNKSVYDFKANKVVRFNKFKVSFSGSRQMEKLLNKRSSE